MSYTEHAATAGLTPEQWHDRLEAAANDPELLSKELAALESEISREGSWLHLNPAPDSLISGVLSFFAGETDQDTLARKIKSELHREHRLKERFRARKPGESWRDRVFAYIKDFPGEILADENGVQFPGFSKYQGLVWNRKPETYVFYINEKFPGRDPANFHVQFDPETGEVLIKRVYKMDLPRPETGSSAARSVLAEMIFELIPNLSVVKSLVVDNAANIKTRQTLMCAKTGSGNPTYEKVEGADAAATPLGHMLEKLAKELGLVPEGFGCQLLPYGMLRLWVEVK